MPFGLSIIRIEVANHSISALFPSAHHASGSCANNIHNVKQHTFCALPRLSQGLIIEQTRHSQFN